MKIHHGLYRKEPIRKEQLDYIFQSWYEIIHDWKPNKLIESPKYEWHYDLISNLTVLHDKEVYSKWVPALISYFCERPVQLENINERRYIFLLLEHKIFGGDVRAY